MSVGLRRKSPCWNISRNFPCCSIFCSSTSFSLFSPLATAHSMLLSKALYRCPQSRQTILIIFYAKTYSWAQFPNRSLKRIFVLRIKTKKKYMYPVPMYGRAHAARHLRSVKINAVIWGVHKKGGKE